MINSLPTMNSATGRALFSARPTDAAAEVVAAGTTSPVTQDAALALYVPFDDSVATLPEAAADESDVEEELDQPADPQQVLLPGLVLPVAAEAVKVADSNTDTASMDAARPSRIGHAVLTPDEIAVLIERAHATLRAVANTPATDFYSVPRSSGQSQAVGVPLALAPGAQALTSEVAEQASLLLASQSANALTASSFAFSQTNVSELTVASSAAADRSAPARQSLAALLGERVHVQIGQQNEHAIIRLDPPSMGVIEIVIRHEAGNVQVQMRASNPEVTRQLHAIGDSIRQDIVQRQHGEVSVHVSDSSRDADGRQRHKQAAQLPDDPGRALGDADGQAAAAFVFDAESMTS